LSGKHSVHTNPANAVYGGTADNSITGSYDFGCGNCHPTDIANHLNSSVDITLNSTHGGVLKSKNNVSDNTSGYTQTAGVSVTCAAAYCHSNGMAPPTYYGAGVDWYEASYAGDKCARCHGNSPNTGGKVGSAAHGSHVIGIHVENIYNGVSGKLPIGGGDLVNAAHGRNNRSTTINCNICHAMTVNTFANDKNSACIGCHEGPAPAKGVASIADKTKHVNGSVEVSFISQPIATKAQVANTAFAAYTANASGWKRNSNGMPYKTYTSSYDYTKSTLFAAATPYTTANGCLNIACHASIQVKWTDTVSCESCHTRLK
jgi:predicted CxxxxCH...CXXCH cytochrome family protein